MLILHKKMTTKSEVLCICFVHFAYQIQYTDVTVQPLMLYSVNQQYGTRKDSHK